MHDRPDLKYLPPDDFARLDYGRLLWKNPRARAHLVAHWLDERHPHHERFAANRELVADLLSSPVDELEKVAARARTSLRAAIREIPPVFGQIGTDFQRAR